MKDKKQRGFAKGVSPNPNGRPVGVLNKSTSEYLKMKQLASENYFEAYAILWQKVKEGDMQAINLFFKELMPKNVKEQPVIIECLDHSIDGQIAALTKGIALFDKHSLESALATIKVLSDIKSSKEEKENVQRISESREEIMAQVNKINEAINYLEKENRA